MSLISVQMKIHKIRIHFHLFWSKSPICSSGTGQGGHPNGLKVPQTPFSTYKQGFLLSVGDSCSFPCPHRQRNSASNLRHFLWFLVHLGSRFWVWTTACIPPCGIHGQELPPGWLLLNQTFLTSGSQNRKERPHIPDMFREYSAGPYENKCSKVYPALGFVS